MPSVRLRVREALLEDVDRGVVRVHPDDLARLGGHEGGVVMVRGKGAAAGHVVSGADLGCIRLDGSFRADTGATIGMPVTVEAVEAADAVAVVFTVFGPAKDAVRSGILGPADVLRALDHRVLYPGTRVPLRPALRGSSLLVTGTAPSGAVVLVPATQVSLVPADTDEPVSPTAAYEDIGGLKRELQRIREMVELPLRHPNLFVHLGIDPPKGLLLHGPPGTGKTLLARVLASEVRSHFIHVNGPEIMHKYYGESEARLRAIFEEAERCAPSIIFLDELDAIAPKRTIVAGEVEKRVVGQLLALMDGLVARGQVIVIGATNMPDLLDPALRRPGRFDREIVTRVPDEHERLEILRVHTRGMPLQAGVDLQHLAEATGGFVGADLEHLCREAAMASLRRVVPSLDLDAAGSGVLLTIAAADFEEALREIEPAATRELRAERPRLTLRDVGGLARLKAELAAILIEPMRRAVVQPSMPLPQTLLFHGPRGTGKRLLATALAGELGMSLLELDPSALLSRWPGETERALAEIFRVANHAAPCLLLVEDLDAVAPVRSAESPAQLSVRLVTKLLRELREAKRTWGLIIVATTDRLELVDPAVIGRFDVVVPFGLPALPDREAIFSIRLGATEPGVDPRALAEASDGLSGEDIDAVCRRAAALALGGPVGSNHLIEALQAARQRRAA